MKASTFIKPMEVTLDFSSQFPENDPGESVLNLVVNPAALTPAMEAELQTATDTKVVTGFIQSLVTSWDLLNDDGSVVPLTEEGLSEIPLMLLGLVVKGVSEEIGEKTSAEGKR